MKIFLLFLGLTIKDTLGQDFGPTPAPAPTTGIEGGVGIKAASSFQNCNCQCNSDTWTDGQFIRGNCRR